MNSLIQPQKKKNTLFRIFIRKRNAVIWLAPVRSNLMGNLIVNDKCCSLFTLLGFCQGLSCFSGFCSNSFVLLLGKRPVFNIIKWLFRENIKLEAWICDFTQCANFFAASFYILITSSFAMFSFIWYTHIICKLLKTHCLLTTWCYYETEILK